MMIIQLKTFMKLLKFPGFIQRVALPITRRFDFNDTYSHFSRR